MEIENRSLAWECFVSFENMLGERKRSKMMQRGNLFEPSIRAISKKSLKNTKYEKCLSDDGESSKNTVLSEVAG